MKLGDFIGHWECIDIMNKYRIIFAYRGEDMTESLDEYERRQVRVDDCKNNAERRLKCEKKLQDIERDVGYRHGKKEIQDNFVTLLGIKTDFE